MAKKQTAKQQPTAKPTKAKPAKPNPAARAARPDPREETPIVTGELTACPACGSTDRTEYKDTRTPLEHAGVTPSGRPYTHVRWKRTCCKGCGQFRIDKTFENRVPAKPSRAA